MVSTYLALTNSILGPFNEVQLTTVNFASATGFQAEAKRYVTQAAFDIYTYQDTEWPFLWAEYSFSTVAGTAAYAKNASVTSVDWDSFYVGYDAINNVPQTFLPILDWDDYRQNYRDIDVNAGADGRSVPQRLVRKPDNGIILTPIPDIVYTVHYEGFAIPTAMSAHSDTTPIPLEFEQVLTDKALHYAYMFRDNLEQANLAQKRYEDNIHKMRRILIPQTEYMRAE